MESSTTRRRRRARADAPRGPASSATSDVPAGADAATVPGHEDDPTTAAAEAFEAARRKFAMYGKQNAHVSHYTTPEKPRDERHGPTTTSTSQSTATSSARRRVSWESTTTTTTTAAVRAVAAQSTVMEGDMGAKDPLRNTLLLQENGELAAHLDEIDYHLDGILTEQGGASGDVAPQRAEAMTSSVLALAELLVSEQVQAVLKLNVQSQDVFKRTREVLLLMRKTRHRLFRMATSALAYVLTLSADSDEFFDNDVLSGLVEILREETSECAGQPKGAISSRDAADVAASGRSVIPLKKSFLKRKKDGLPQRTSSSSSSVKVDKNGRGSTAEQAGALALRDEQVQERLVKLLDGHEAFIVDGRPQLSTMEILTVVIHNLLQIGGPSLPSEGFGSERTSHRHFYQRQDLAGATFTLIMARKRQLIKNQGVDVLMNILSLRFASLERNMLKATLGPVTLADTCEFQQLRTVLRVLDQASFLASDVQQYMSKEKMVFEVSLGIIDALSTRAWAKSTRQEWQNDPAFMQLVVEVWMAALRVLINLSHHNEDAARHIAACDGTKVLFFAFCKLWGIVELDANRSDKTMASIQMEDKLIFDAFLLLLSAITNCVEYSTQNRESLSTLTLAGVNIEGLEAYQSSSVCDVLVSFFLSKVKSYLKLIEMSESQDQGEDIEREAWIPEDVILGGCSSLLLGCLMKNSSYNSATILGALPDGSPRLLLRALSAFVAFHSQLGALTPEVGKSVLEVESLLKSFLFHGADYETTQILENWEGTGGQIPVNHIREVRESHNSLSTQWSIPVQDPTSSTHSGRLMVHVQVDAKSRLADVEEIKHDLPIVDSAKESEAASAQGVRSPPASAFKLRRYKSVCSNVDDSDIDSDSERCPKIDLPFRPKGPAVDKQACRTPVNKILQPEQGSRTKSSSIRRLKRTRQLVSDLEAEFMKVGKRVSDEIISAVTSSEDADVEGLDFSQDLSSCLDATAQTAGPRGIDHQQDLSLTTVITQSRSMRKATIKANVAPPTHRRKLKAARVDPATASKPSTNSVFDFPG